MCGQIWPHDFYFKCAAKFGCHTGQVRQALAKPGQIQPIVAKLSQRRLHLVAQPIRPHDQIYGCATGFGQHGHAAAANAVGEEDLNFQFFLKKNKFRLSLLSNGPGQPFFLPLVQTIEPIYIYPRHILAVFVTNVMVNSTPTIILRA